ncbi:MAG TPA: ATP-dependent DNA helicase RecG, partial [Candidatus Ratteibacteria bacterium]|nr:ATP-dependent DNA helicase RecG [Candidatus Ratteibacteria bacterium]
RKYIDLRNIKKIYQIQPGDIVTIKGNVIAVEEKRRWGRIPYLKVAISDGTGILYLVFFNQTYLKNIFKAGEKFFIYGGVEKFNNQLEIVSPFYEKEENGKIDYILPVYPLTEGLSQRYLRKILKFLLENLLEYPPEFLPIYERQKYGFSNIKHALKNIHFPFSEINLQKSRSYLIFREFFILQLNLLWKKNIEQNIIKEKLPDIKIDEKIIDIFQAKIPFKLTKGQIDVIVDIINDLKKEKLIRRLIHGEVGSGKTVIAIFALWFFARSGYQAILLAPTEILAEQHYLNWQEFFLMQDINVSLLVGQLSEKEKEEMREKIKSGEIQVVIGTHALLSEKVEFKNLKMVVIDEQHKFGVEQREILKQKGEGVHHIVMSATPIPRSVALTIYGDMDFSTLGDLPKGRRDVITYLFHEKEKNKIYSFIEYQTKKREKGFIITPSIKGNEDIKSAEEEYNRIRNILPDIKVGLIHGKLPQEEKEKTMQMFRNGQLQLLVATTVVESGIDVPEASFIIVEQAERFGLAQLHQLRGRVGRSGNTGYCFLVVYTDNKEIIERIESFIEAESGFEIAEIDLKLRGPGDLLGTRQHGILPLKIGDIMKDMELLKIARKKVEEILSDDPKLEKEKNKIIRTFINV